MSLSKINSVKEFDFPLFPLPGFLQEKDSSGISFYIHPKRGQVIFENKNDESAPSNKRSTQFFRKYSYWTRPMEQYTSIDDMRQDELMILVAEKSLVKKNQAPPITMPFSMKKGRISRDDALLLKQEGLLGYYGPRIAEQIAVSRIINWSRIQLAKLQVRSLVQTFYEKIYDDSCGFFFFRHLKSGYSQWHRPFGFGFSMEYDIPETETLPLPKGGDQPDVKISNQSNQCMIKPTTYPPLDYLNSLLIQKGPYFVRIPNQPSNKVQKQMIHTIHNCRSISDDHGSNIIINHPRELLNALMEPIDYSASSHNPSSESSSRNKLTTSSENPSNTPKALLGAKYQCYDGSVLIEVTMDPYSLLRAAYEKGIFQVLSILNQYNSNTDVIIFGCIMLAKYEYVENDQGLSTQEAIEVRDFCLLLIREWNHTENLSIVASSVNVLVTLTEVYANRVSLHETNWVGQIMKCASLLKSQIEEESIFNTDLCIYEINEIQVATTSSVDLAANICRLFSNMAYDDSFRDFVAEHGLPIVMQCMKFCDSHTFVLRYGCFAIFNFIYRNEKHYKQALQKNVPEFLTSILNEFGHKDKELYAAVERSKSLLLPNGWRLID